MKYVTSTLSLFLFASLAQAAGPSLTYHGRLLGANGSPIITSVQFKLQVRSPGAEDCLLYEETQIQDLTNTSGVFALSINGSHSTRTDGGALTFNQIFSNRNIMNLGGGRCASGTSYTPVATDGRVLKVSFNDGSFSGWEDAPAQTLAFVSQAIDSQQVNGYPSTSLLRVDNGAVPGTATALTPANFTELMALLNGTSTQFAHADGTGFTPAAAVSFNSQRITNVATPTSANDATNKTYTDSNVGGKSVDTSVTGIGAGDTGKVLSWDGTKWIASSASTSDATKLPLAGGTMSGAITMAGNNILTTGSITQNGGKFMQFGSVNDTAEATLTGGLTSGHAGATWYNTTTNQLKVWDGSAAQPVGAYWNSVTGGINYAGGKVGIGTTSPVAMLDVNGDIRIASSLGGVDASGANVAGSALTFKASRGTGTGAGGPIYFQTAPAGASSSTPNALATPLTILGNGYVGIANTSPQTNLDVTGSLRVTNQFVVGLAGAFISDPGNTGDLILNPGGLGVIGTGWGSVLQVNGGTGAPVVKLAGTGASYFGNSIGAGVTTPTAQLHIAAGSATAGTTPLKLTLGTLTTAPEKGAIEYDGTNLYFTDNSSTRQKIGTTTGGSVGGNTSIITNSSGNITMAPTASSGSVIVNSGTVSSGTTSGALVVSGGVGVSGAINAGGAVAATGNVSTGGVMLSSAGTQALPSYSFSGDTASGMWSPTAGILAFSTNATEKMRIDSNGKVGVGTSTLSSQFTVAGAASTDVATFTTNSGASAVFDQYGSLKMNSGIMFTNWDSNVSAAALTTYNQPLYITTDSGAASNHDIIIKPRGTGKVGIGTTSPNAALEVSGAIRLSSSVVDNYTTPVGASVPTKINVPLLDPGAYGQVMAMGVPSTAQSTSRVITLFDARSSAHQPTLMVLAPNESEFLGLNFNGSNTVGTVGSSVDLSLSAGGSEAIRVLSSGKVGIGTSSPAEKLDVAGNIQMPNASTIYTKSSGGSVTNLIGMASYNEVTVGGNSNNKTNLVAGGTQTLTVTGSAVGIANTSPTEKLDIGTTSNTGNIRLYHASGSGGLILTDPSSNTMAVRRGSITSGLAITVGTTNTNALNLQTNNANRIIIDSSGNVTSSGNISPASDAGAALGSSGARWSAVWSSTGTIQTSDARLKKNITNTDLGLQFINRLRPVSYHWKDGSDENLHYGLIAQETEKIIQEEKAKRGIASEPTIVTHDMKTDRYGMNYAELISPVIKAIQELYDGLMGTRAEVAALRAENVELKARLDRIESQLNKK